MWKERWRTACLTCVLKTCVRFHTSASFNSIPFVTSRKSFIILQVFTLRRCVVTSSRTLTSVDSRTSFLIGAQLIDVVSESITTFSRVISNLALSFMKCCFSLSPNLTDFFSALPCNAHSHFNPRMSACQPTCADAANQQAPCTLPDQEGCECDVGFRLSGLDCVPIEDCGCLVDGVYLRVGSRTC